MNTSGVIVIGIGLFILIVAIRGTQNAVFPFAFSPTSSASGSASGTQQPGPGGTTVSTSQCESGVPDKNGNCCPGYANVFGKCIKWIPVIG